MTLNHLVTRSPSDAAGAVFSPCEKYRYRLWRQWDDMLAKPGYVLWCMLNPSTADESVLDPTLRRCKGFTERFWFARFEVVNLFALRSTDPAALRRADDPIGPDNDAVIAAAIRDAALVVVGWGAFPLAAERSKRIVELAAGEKLHCLGKTQTGRPRHPLYLAKDTMLWPWGPR